MEERSDIPWLAVASADEHSSSLQPLNRSMEEVGCTGWVWWWFCLWWKSGGKTMAGSDWENVFLSLRLSLVFYPSLFRRSACCRQKGDAAHAFFYYLRRGTTWSIWSRLERRERRGIPHRHHRVFTRWPAFSNKSRALIAVNSRCIPHCIRARQGMLRIWPSRNVTWPRMWACPCVQSLNSIYIRKINPNTTLRLLYTVHRPFSLLA